MPAVKPDPPLNVTVEALEKAPQRLRVTWTYPSSWDPRFYWLRFQVRYRPEPTPTFTEVSPHPERSRTLGPLGLPPPPPGSHRPCPRQVDQVTRTWLDIRDAWRGTRHLVQVRAQEEFGHGAWSEWSHEAVGTPWTGTGGGRGRACPHPGCAAVSRTSHLADPRDVTEMGPYSSQVGRGVVPPSPPPKCPPARRCSELPRPTVFPPLALAAPHRGWCLRLRGHAAARAL